MRSAGIPARLVGGYLGGRYNVQEKFITVRQMDAHAWTEVWLSGRGWVRVDPTAAVAPERVRQDLSELFADSPDFVAELAGRTSAFLPLKRVQLWLDKFEYQWQRWVVQFDENSRMGLFNRLLGNRDLLERIAWLLAAFAVIPLFWLLLLGRSQTLVKESAALRCLNKLEKKLAKAGVHRQAGESVAEFLQRAVTYWPDKQPQLESFSQLFYQLEYSSADFTSREQIVVQLRKLVAQT